MNKAYLSVHWPPLPPSWPPPSDYADAEDVISRLKDVELSGLSTKSINEMWTGEAPLGGVALDKAAQSLPVQLTADLAAVMSYKAPIDVSDESGEAILDKMASSKIDLKALVLALRKLIEAGAKHGIIAARAYLSILAQKDASAYDLFNIFAVKSVLELTKRWVLAHIHRSTPLIDCLWIVLIISIGGRII